MQKFSVSGSRTALLTASALTLAFALAGCTSVELAEQERTPKLAATQAPPSAPQVADATSAGVEPSEQNVAATTQTESEADAKSSTATALSAPNAASNSASEAIAAASKPEPATASSEQSAPHPKFAEAKLVKADFPPRPGPPTSPSAAPVPLTLEMMQAQNVVPMQKPRIPELAYAAAPKNAALAAIAEDEAQMVSKGGPVLRGKSQLNSLIQKYAKLYEVPEELVHRVVHRESRYNPSAYNSGNYGLMQIRLGTAKGLGFKGTTKDLFDAETNLKYAVKYLRGAYLVADNNHDQAVRLYARGYYFDAKRKGMLHVLN